MMIKAGDRLSVLLKELWADDTLLPLSKESKAKIADFLRNRGCND